MIIIGIVEKTNQSNVHGVRDMIIQTKNCLNCNNIIIKEKKHKNNWHLKKFCSDKCSNSYHYFAYKKIRRQRAGFRAQKQGNNCSWCNKIFEMLNSSHRFCSSNCRTLFFHRKISLKSFKRNSQRKCLCCKNIFFYTRNNQKFCGKKCCEKYYDDLRLTKKKGRPREIAKRLELTIKEYNLLKEKCVICEWKYNINIHHIVPKSLGGINSIENYLPLCPNCHKLIHSSYSIQEIKEIVKLYNFSCPRCRTMVRVKKSDN